MPKNDNAHAIRFMQSMEKHGKHDEAHCFAKNNPLSKSATADKKLEWANRQCDFLKDRFDDKTVKTIRMDCACEPEYGKLNKLKTIYEKSNNFKEFTQKANELNQGFTIEYDGTFLYLVYPQCYCSCVKRFETTLPKEWCYCTLGYAKKMFEYILGTSVDVGLLKSVKQGDSVCKIQIELLEGAL